MASVMTSQSLPPADRSGTAGLQEIFSSIQGEGPWVGRRQVFVRFNACHLKCAYCDTPQKPAAERCRVEPVSGSGEAVYLNNPVSAETVLDWIRRFSEQARHHSVSFTGGEPLLYVDFLKTLLPQVAPVLPVYLETSGTQPEALQALLPWIRIVAMDIKLPSTTKEPMRLEAHRQFYALSREKDHFVKLVFSDETPLAELDAVYDIVTDTATPIILQPMTQLDTGECTVSQAKVFELETALSRRYPDVRVIPQTHRMLNLL